ncbi:alpha/beta hydrolase-fold protein [Hymenobacter sp. YC55]|uniref:alpha/beta hydrolase-fold protein n=1 Tax=Hymenobacter sp. YC55 TaxID=3034019 RepID=UPI0023F6C615|nr:alpha/beta hydrolase-fold protein [Hymenobacter sp. YC55]
MTGITLDLDSKKPLPDVTIRLKRSAKSTRSLADGSFSLQLPPPPHLDTLVFSRIGYSDLQVAPNSLAFGKPQHFYLKPRPLALSPVMVTTKKLVEKKFGITNHKALLHFTDGTMAPGKPFEIAQVIRLGSAVATLTSVNLYLAASQPDSATVTVRFYAFDGDQPTKAEVAKPVVRRVAIEEGWLKLILPKQAIHVQGDVVVGLEFSPSSNSRYSIPYEIKLGGTTKSFARNSRETDWRVPPHHYRLYVTALVPNSTRASRPDDSENQETAPSARLFSKAVQDSFSVYVQLPKGYAAHKKRRYPVVLVLDANAYFDIVRSETKKLKSARPPILVGVGYQDALQMDSLRQRDYLYPAAPPADSLPLSGGGMKFLSFFQSELLPYLDHNYRTDANNRTLMGHSFGGYFVLYALAEALQTDTCYFTRYVAASPSLYYGNEYLRREFTAAHKASAHPNVQTLYLTMGSQELDGNNAESAATKVAFNSFVGVLSASQLPALKLQQTIYPGYTHMETAVPSFIEGLEGLYQQP